MRHVELQDLKHTGRLLLLYEDAQRLSLVGSGYEEQLLFVGAAERALMRGTINPCGFFVRVVRSKLWHHVTNGDEDAAHIRIKEHLYGAQRKRERKEQRRVRPQRIELSADARMVVAVQRVAREQRIPGEPFYLLRAHSADWTRERWERAVDEIERARFTQMQRNAVGCESE